MAGDSNNLIELTADIVSSHVTKNSVSISDLPALIQQVHVALASLGHPQQEPEQAARAPAVTARASIKPDYLICMACGAKQKTLKRHLQNAHEMTPQQYREAFALKADYPMVAPAYSHRRRELAHAIGLGRKKSSDKAAPSKPRRRKRKAAEGEQ